MFQIDALPAFSDNYIWLLQDNATRRCAVVDPGDAQPVLNWLAAHPDWQLTDILVTHHHPDHVGGVVKLKDATGARVSGPAQENIPARDLALDDGAQVEVLGRNFLIYAVPGHTLGHIAYYQAEEGWLFCGDTLFAAGCGRLFEGTPQQMNASLQRLAALPDATAVYCTHEYTLSNLHFARAVEPHNPAVAARFAEVSAWRANGRISLPSNIALEKATNPFLRCDETSIKEKIDERNGAQQRTADEVFACLRSWKDQFKAA
ncbi:MULTISPECIES: hydroxyacylglutathione hydrolase [unclassified Pseudomonas]|uniref:hydroxyacylglutathione hydrolase n=1 Tax=unclassified Pseudomonas TaxID=196821 RepID=UPI00244B902C|nr:MULTISPECIES: hydroxyacylglutathione hydrolase [unclassified Pseudomonas]MDG9923581.1 hydroxyacylglutathione hydrolase [Pseudomonas sp. GD04045]MDH0036343.1 hydroxyacylglutathione hydrolase [Pseudomonas sp. GD04019]